MKSQWGGLWLAIGMTVIGCGGDDDAAESATGAEGAEAAAEGAEAPNTSTEGAEESGETDAESAVAAACMDLCAKEFDECAAGAPEGWYDYEDPEDDWPQDLDSCNSSCAERGSQFVAKGQECVDQFLGGASCLIALSCEALWQHNSSPDEGPCAEAAEFVACLDEE